MNSEYQNSEKIAIGKEGRRAIASFIHFVILLIAP
jgi:hypothetical protein